MRYTLSIAAFALTVAGCAEQPKSLSGSSVVPPLDRAENRVYGYDAQIAACDSPRVLEGLKERFATRESVNWNSSLTITAIDHVRQTSFRPHRASLIPRRFCAARAVTSDGHRRSIEYSLAEDGGTSGRLGSLFGLYQFPTPGSYHIEWCVSGLDRSRVYAQDCRMARP
jgi:hypothetical protein